MNSPTLQDQSPSTSQFLEEVQAGLREEPKTLPSKYLYDERGSQLFDQICEQPEYYPTRTELGLMEQFGVEMAEAIGPDAVLVEYGSGSSLKTRLLLDQLGDRLAAYVPIDISLEHLQNSAETLQEAYPKLHIHPVCADFTEPFDLPEVFEPHTRTIVYFPGSTIGNFDPPQIHRLLDQIAEQADALLIGIDLVKPLSILEAAYDDAAGVTAEFNKNLLRHINRELDADFDLDQFDHRAVWNEEEQRIEMHLVSRTAQTVQVGEELFEFDRGESIHTENSHKFTVDVFAEMGDRVGLALKRSWVAKSHPFGVLFLEGRSER